MASSSPDFLFPASLSLAGGSETLAPFRKIYQGDARRLPDEIAPHSVDLVITSPPYWRKRDYGIEGQIGQEKRPINMFRPSLTPCRSGTECSVPLAQYS